MRTGLLGLGIWLLGGMVSPALAVQPGSSTPGTSPAPPRLQAPAVVPPGEMVAEKAPSKCSGLPGPEGAQDSGGPRILGYGYDPAQGTVTVITGDVSYLMWQGYEHRRSFREWFSGSGCPK
ncbi:MAG: hypothetical protein JO112_06280 [Planctomycetes bacterium]|nr:hypothetical protein [Planctomycetota bacterium]